MILVLVKRRYTHHLDLVIFLRISLCLDYNAIYIIDDKLETKYMSCDKKEPKNSVHIPVENFEEFFSKLE